ncbi:MAG: hypothetical protein DMG41_05265, partial [Acidobacteria bacterium]
MSGSLCPSFRFSGQELDLSAYVRPRRTWGFYEFRRQLEYKAKLNGAELVIASRWFPSSKMCSVCGRIAEDLPLSAREWTRECGAFHDRDINAAKNLCCYPLAR